MHILRPIYSSYQNFTTFVYIPQKTVFQKKNTLKLELKLNPSFDIRKKVFTFEFKLLYSIYYIDCCTVYSVQYSLSCSTVLFMLQYSIIQIAVQYYLGCSTVLFRLLYSIIQVAVQYYLGCCTKYNIQVPLQLYYLGCSTLYIFNLCTVSIIWSALPAVQNILSRLLYSFYHLGCCTVYIFQVTQQYLLSWLLYSFYYPGY